MLTHVDGLKNWNELLSYYQSQCESHFTTKTEGSIILCPEKEGEQCSFHNINENLLRPKIFAFFQSEAGRN